MIAPPARSRPRGLLVDDEGAANVRAVHPVEGVEVEVDERGQRHDTRRVDDDVDPAVRVLRRVEEGRDLVLVGHIGTDGDRLPALLGDRGDGLVGLGLIARVIDDDGKSVGGEALGGLAADPPRTAGDDGDTEGRTAGGLLTHDVAPCRDWGSGLRFPTGTTLTLKR